MVRIGLGSSGRNPLVAVSAEPTRHHPCYGPLMLGAGDRVPDARVWTAPGEEPVQLRDALGGGLSLLCFYLWDWSPT
jgi:hypothetical protein